MQSHICITHSKQEWVKALKLSVCFIFAHLTAIGKWNIKYAWQALRLTISWKTVAQWFSVKSIFDAI